MRSHFRQLSVQIHFCTDWIVPETCLKTFFQIFQKEHKNTEIFQEIFHWYLYTRAAVDAVHCVAIVLYPRWRHIIAHNAPYGGVSIPLRRMTSLRRRAQANAPAASYRFHRVLDNETGLVHRAEGCGGGACNTDTYAAQGVETLAEYSSSFYLPNDTTVLTSYSWEEQDSKVRQEHLQLPRNV